MSDHICVRHGARELSGVARGGESWHAAACRIAATTTGRPVALDLSGDPKVFGIEPDQRVTLRSMTRGDLPDVARWRATEHVDRWFAEDGSPDLATVSEVYGPNIDGQTPTRMWVVEVNGRSIGFVQDYRICDYPEFALLAPDSGAIGVDYAIGEEAWLGKGIGTRMLWAWIERAHRRFPEATSFFAAPDHRNTPSLRVLARAGFREGVWFDEPQRSGLATTMVGCTLDVPRVIGRPRP